MQSTVGNNHFFAFMGTWVRKPSVCLCFFTVGGWKVSQLLLSIHLRKTNGLERKAPSLQFWNRGFDRESRVLSVSLCCKQTLGKAGSPSRKDTDGSGPMH